MAKLKQSKVGNVLHLLIYRFYDLLMGFGFAFVLNELEFSS